MYKYKFKCDICSNTHEKDTSSLPQEWWYLEVSRDIYGDHFKICVCKFCLPTPVMKSQIQGLIPWIRKKLFS